MTLRIIIGKRRYQFRYLNRLLFRCVALQKEAGPAMINDRLAPGEPCCNRHAAARGGFDEDAGVRLHCSVMAE